MQLWRWILPVLAVILCGTGAGSLRADEFHREVYRRIDQAMNAQTVEQAQAQLDAIEQEVIAQKGGGRELESGFLQADVVQARGKVLVHFILNETQAGPESLGRWRQNARGYLQESIEGYTELIDEADQSAGTLLRGLGQAGAVRSDRYQRYMGMTSRGDYSIGWSLYYLGLIAADEKAGREKFETALERFSGFISPGFRENALVADVFFGAGLCLYEMGLYEQVRELLDERIIRPDNTDRQGFANITRLRVRNYQAMDMHYFAALAAGYYLDGFTPKAGQEEQEPAELDIFYLRVKSLAQAAVHSGSRSIQKKSRKELTELTEEILLGRDPRRLAILSIFRDVGYDSPAVVLNEAREIYNAGDYRRCLAKINELSEAELASQWLREAIYLRILCSVRLEDRPETVLAYLEYIDRFPEDQLSAELVRSVIGAGLDAVRKGRIVLLPDVEKVLGVFAGRYPQAADEQAWYRALLAVYLDKAEQALGHLKRISDAGAFGLRAKYLKAYVLYGQLVGEINKAQSRTVLGSSGGDGWFVKAASVDTDKLDEVADLLSAFCRGDHGLVEEDICKGVYRLGAGHLRLCLLESVRVEIGPQERQLWEDLNGLACAELNTAEVFDIAAGTAGAVGNVQEFNRLVAQVESWTLKNLLAGIRGVHYLLDYELGSSESMETMFGLEMEASERLEDSPSQIFQAAETFCEKAVKEARDRKQAEGLAVLLQAARAYRRIQNPEAALVILDSIEQEVAGRQRLIYSIERALVHESLGRYERAIESWRYLARRLEPGSDGFCLAQLKRIMACFAANQPRQAQKLLENYRLRYFDMTLSPWQEQFEALRGDGEETN